MFSLSEISDEMIKDYLDEEDPMFLLRIYIHTWQKSLAPEKVLKIGTEVYPIRNGFGTNFGGFFKIVSFDSFKDKFDVLKPYAIIKRISDHSDHQFILSFDTWYKDVVLVPKNLTNEQKWTFDDEICKIWDR